MRRVLAIAIGFTFAFAALACLLGKGAGADGEDAGKREPGAVVQVGAVLELSGHLASYGEEARNGISLALEDLKGKRPWSIEVVFADCKSEAQATRQAVSGLIARDQVVAIVGAVASANTIAGAGVAQQAGIPMISPASTNANVTKVGDCVSRVCLVDDLQGDAMARLAYDDLGRRKAALVVDEAQDSCFALAGAFRSGFEQLGGRVVATERYSGGDADFAKLIARVREAAPDVIFIPGTYGDVGPKLKQAAAAWAGIPKLGGDGWDSPHIFELAGAAALADTYIASHFAFDDPDPAARGFVERYWKRFRQRPGSVSALAYDAVVLLADAIGRAGSSHPAKIKEAIHATKHLQGTVTGEITLDADRNPRKEAVIVSLGDGAFRFQARKGPRLPSDRALRPGSPQGVVDKLNAAVDADDARAWADCFTEPFRTACLANADAADRLVAVVESQFGAGAGAEYAPHVSPPLRARLATHGRRNAIEWEYEDLAFTRKGDEVVNEDGAFRIKRAGDDATTVDEATRQLQRLAADVEAGKYADLAAVKAAYERIRRPDR